MGMMKSLNQYLKQRGNRWYYQRQVPSEYADFDDRGLICKALKTESLEVARARRDSMKEADEQFWATVSSTARCLSDRSPQSEKTKMAMRAYQAARQRAMARGFLYTPIQEIAATEDVADILDRIKSIPDHGEPAKQDADAVLGTVPPPDVRLSQALEIYFSEIAVTDQLGKSDAQKKSWQKVKRRAVNNFIAVVDDMPMHKINRDHARKFYNWWAARLHPTDGSRPLTGNSADRDLGNLRKLFREYWKYEGDEGRQNPFRNLNFGNANGIKDIPHFEDEFVRTRLLAPGVFKGLNEQAALIVYAMIETGCRPSEISNMLPENIILDADLPHIRIKPTSERQLKTYSSVRDIPLVGVSLEAFKRAPKGFPHYRDKGNLLSASLMKAFRSRGLMPTEDHRIYSFRHSFEKRMLEAGLDYGLRCLLMGHKNSRPLYGDGGSMEYRRDELLKIVHPVESNVLADLPRLKY